MSFGQEGLRALYVFGRQRRGIKCLAANKEAPGQLYGGKYGGRRRVRNLARLSEIGCSDAELPVIRGVAGGSHQLKSRNPSARVVRATCICKG